MKSWTVRICSLIVAFAMIANILPHQAYAVALDTINDSNSVGTVASDYVSAAPTETAEDVAIVGEIVEKRTEYSKEFKLSNGLHMMTVYSRAVHYLNDGQWNEIDNTLKAVGTGDGAAYTNTAGTWEVRLPQTLSRDNAVSVTKDGYTVSFSMNGEIRQLNSAMIKSEEMSVLSAATKEASYSISKMQASIAQIPENKSDIQSVDVQYPETICSKSTSRIVYPNVHTNTNIIYDLISSELKESIVISKYDAALQGYSYVLNTGALVPVLQEDGRIDLLKPDMKEAVFSMPAPFMVDNNGEYSYDVEVTLEKVGNTYLLTYIIPRDWLADSSRAWPVILDPVISEVGTHSSVQDRTVSETTTHSYTSAIIQCGYRTTTGLNRFFVKFEDLPELSASDVIVDAYVSLYKPQTSSVPVYVEAHKVLQDWDSQTITWANQPSFDPEVEDFYMSLALGVHKWNITDIVRYWYETGNNYGILFKASAAGEAVSTDNFKQYYSSDNSTTNPQIVPNLYITFRNNNGLEDYWDYTSTSAGRAGTGFVNNYSGNLTWIRSDIGFDGNRMPVSINHVYNSNDAWDLATNAGSNPFGLGNGWRTNYHQTVEKWSDDSSVYVWEDADGTRHYFAYDSTSGTYKDEDGLELALTVNSDQSSYITDKYGNISKFDSAGRLIELKNNQKSASSILITYTATSGNLISSIKDGAGRTYSFQYNASNLLSKIIYRGTAGTSEVSSVTYSYSGSDMTQITDKDGKASAFTYYFNSRLASVTDVDGYKVTYTYDSVVSGKQNRVIKIEETDGTALGGVLNFTYTHNQTIITDHNNNAEIMQFNDWGNTISVQDGQGRAVFSQYALHSVDTSLVNSAIAADNTAKGNQLRRSSRMQNTVSNLEPNSSFEDYNNWHAINGYVTAAVSSEYAYSQNKSLKIVRSTAGSFSGVRGMLRTLPEGTTITFSAYVKSISGRAHLAIASSDDSLLASSETLASGSDWTRLEVSYTFSGTIYTVYPQLRLADAGTIYLDCVQVELTPTASRYNLIENGSFSLTHPLRWDMVWTRSSGCRNGDDVVSAQTAAALNMDSSAMQIKGKPDSQKYVYQTLNISGAAGDAYVLSGWAKGNSAPLIEHNGHVREFALKAIFNNTDGTTTPCVVSFSADLPSDGNWQYAATPAVATKPYSSITVQVVYNYNVNTVYFDGIQLFKETFGSSYTYDTKGNVTSVIDLQNQETKYVFDTNNNLTHILQNNTAKMTYGYDSHHNIVSATTQEGVTYELAYDDWGNNTRVSIIYGNNKITSTATYSTDGNRLVSTTDALGNVTTFQYHADTNVLEWVQYPKDTEATRAAYSYDNMYRVATAQAKPDGYTTLSAAYTYTDDYLAAIQTGSAAYHFTYGDFGLTTNVKVGNQNLATYSYTTDRNHYLQALDYGNGDGVQYEYDSLGRVVKETFEDGAYVTYLYDNNGALATITDSETAGKTTYYYDFTDRLMKYVETAPGVAHSVEYTYDTRNNLTQLKESIDGLTYISQYTYDDDYRIKQITGNRHVVSYGYDEYGRTDYTSTAVDGDTNAVIKEYRYATVNGSPTSRVANLQVDTPNFVVNFDYQYDSNGNLVSVEYGTVSISYTYDAANQLVRENNSGIGKTYTWEYDDAGNILCRREYAYTTGTLGTPVDTVLYSYGNSNWGDVLTAYDGVGRTYDGIGNLLTDGTWNYTWKHGRQLVSMSDSSGIWYYIYDANGMRIRRNHGYDTYMYVYNGDQLVQMTKPGHTLKFYYDAGGAPVMVLYNNTPYYYVTNLQGDTIMLLRADGGIAVTYTLDAWGRVYAIDGSMASTLGVLNPLIYRGYVYDHETGLYYLNSRYYDPEIGRFINADVLISTGQGLLGNNMFAYCRNNPVARKDVYGTADVETYLDDGSDGDIQVVPKELDGTSSFAYAYNPIDAGYSYGVNMSQAANSSLANGGLYANGYVAYNYYANPNNSSANSTIQNNNPLVNVSYTNKVISDMQKSDYHGFSMLVDNHGALGKLSILQGGDKNTYFKLMIPGSYLGHDGYFTYIWNTKGQCNHRCFEER